MTLQRENAGRFNYEVEEPCRLFYLMYFNGQYSSLYVIIIITLFVVVCRHLMLCTWRIAYVVAINLSFLFLLCLSTQ